MDERTPPLSRWEGAYRQPVPPAWDIGRPQAAIVRLEEAGAIASPVLDSGCGTGEHAIFLAERGHEVVGLDIAHTAIAKAEAKAARRGVRVEFLVGSVLELDRLHRQFATIIDSGVFHVMSDEERPRYVASLATTLRTGGSLHMMCFSERTPGDYGPRRVTQAEIRAAFDQGWRVEGIEEASFEVRDDFPTTRPRAWLAHLRRT